MDDQSIIENTAKVEINKMIQPADTPCVRVLGGKGNLMRAASLSLQFSDILRLISANLVLGCCMGESRSTEENKAYKQGVMGFIDFLTSCVNELEQLNKQERVANGDKTEITV